MKFIKKNDVVDIISPATACTLDDIKKIKNLIKEMGLIPNVFLEKETALKKPASNGFPSSKASQRFEQFKKAVENSQSKIIWCSRGGYGSAEILPFLKTLKKPKTPKIFIGFSDITSLNKFLIEEWNWQVLSAPMLAQIALSKVSETSKKTIFDLIFGKKTELKYALKNLNNSKSAINGMIVGGCISVLAGHFGTKNQIDWNNKILFLEDIGEGGEKLDRYFNQITRIISEQKKSPLAIVLGNFLEPNLYASPAEKNIEIAIKKFTENNPKIPFFTEKSKRLGHSKDMLPLILGSEAKITRDNFLIQNA
jgi:muramoyltetrapeptide carboxypeptidase